MSNASEIDVYPFFIDESDFMTKQYEERSARGFATSGTNTNEIIYKIYYDKLCHRVGLFYLLEVDGLAALHKGHCGHQPAHRNAIVVVDSRVWTYTHLLAYDVNITLGVVLGCRCPSRYDHGHRVFVITSDVSTEYDECGT